MKVRSTSKIFFGALFYGLNILVLEAKNTVATYVVRMTKTSAIIGSSVRKFVFLWQLKLNDAFQRE
jgi:hypothetical protein